MQGQQQLHVHSHAIPGQGQAGRSCAEPRTPGGFGKGFGKGCTFSSLLMFLVEVLQVMEGMGSPEASQVSVI